MKKLILLIMLFFALDANADQLHLIPGPKQVKIISQKRVNASRIIRTVDGSIELPAEGYKLNVAPGVVRIVAKDSAGLVWAGSTLDQLYDDNGRLPRVEIVDYPSFPFRGFMHDTGRNFLEISMIKEHLDVLSAYKINVFHWHLTDNPAWRIESKVYPQLNDPKFQRKGRDEGRYYTYDQIRDVIQYAKQRGIMIVPEIDMPGHSKFFNDTFGFSMDSEQGRAVLEKCLEEFFTEIPSAQCPYFHIGSDEVHIADPQGFMSWAEGLTAKYGRKTIAWDPGLPSSPSTVRQIWNEAEGANTAATQKTGKYLDSFMGYLNYYDPIVFTSRNFLHKACGVEKSNDNAIGGILCLWNDVNVNDKSRVALHNGMMNGLLAFSERFWCGGNPDPAGEVKNLNVLPSPESEAGQALASFEKKLSHHRNKYLPSMRWVANSFQRWTIFIGDTVINAWGGAIDMDALCAVHGIKSGDTMDAKAITYIYSDLDTVIRAWVGFEAPARSNRISVGIGPQDKWEGQGKLTVNDTEITPPQKWNEPGKYAYNFHTWHKPQEEEPYTDEQFYWMREPAYIPIKKGENRVEMIVPKTFSGQRWSFAFMPLTVDEKGNVKE